MLLLVNDLDDTLVYLRIFYVGKTVSVFFGIEKPTLNMNNSRVCLKKSTSVIKRNEYSFRL
jgi:hypothetical protein